jgi:hypothetical protein
MATRPTVKLPTIHGLIGELRTLERRHKRAVNVPTDAQQRAALRKALRGAVAIEFATIPPYLTALWSFKDQRHPVAVSLRNIVQEEMLHLGLASNMLAAIGGTPQFNVAAPTYPCKLPLGVHPELTVALSGFSSATLDVFMEIERPGSPGYRQWLKHSGGLDGKEHPDADLTIGAFYDQILQAFKCLADATLSTDHQLSGPLSWRVVRCVKDVQQAIGIIQHQGEGSTGGPVAGWDGHLAHFYRFAEMKERKHLVCDPTTKTYSFTTPIALDLRSDVWPVAALPAGGYGRVKDPEVCRLLREFNLAYSRLLDLFQAAWSQPGGQSKLIAAIAVMFDLTEHAKTLMRTRRRDGPGNYGPEFRYIPAEKP